MRLTLAEIKVKTCLAFLKPDSFEPICSFDEVRLSDNLLSNMILIFYDRRKYLSIMVNAKNR